MIPITDVSWQGQTWQTQLKHSIKTSEALALALNLPLNDVETGFATNVPMPYLSRIEPGNPRDPLLLQVLATQLELNPTGLESPLSEEAFSKGFGMIQKYHGRVLVVTSGACAIHCRYCFRRHFPYETYQPSSDDWQQIFEQIQSDSSISEVILSGGDPLMLKDQRLDWIYERIAKIEHVTTVRLHTRLPIVLPARVTTELLSTIADSRLDTVLVTHTNHANEIDEQVINACRKLSQHGVTLLNQSVLLKDINDSISALESLSRKLIQGGIVPYYLHLMDPVMGAEHFTVDDASGIKLIEALRNRLPGYLVPRLSRETPFESAKTVIA